MTERGWMPGVEQFPTAAKGYGTLPNRPIAVMSHIMQGFQSTMIDWSKERPPQRMASSHFSLNRAGRKVQHLSIYEPSWAAGRVNRPTWPGYRLNTNPNHYTVSLECEGFAIAPGYGYDYIYDAAHPWPEAMVKASIEIHRWVFNELGLKANLETVIGHFETDALNRPHDPGPEWPRDRIITELNRAGGVPVDAPRLPPTLTRFAGAMQEWNLGSEPFEQTATEDMYLRRVPRRNA